MIAGFDTRPTLLCFGLGYCSLHYVKHLGVKHLGRRFARVIGTTRSKDKAERLAAEYGVEALVFDGAPTADIFAAIAVADAMLISTPPTSRGDPVLTALSDAIGRSRATTIVYLSSVGVYGDHGGAFVDETTIPHPTSARGRDRLAAEIAWQTLGEHAQKRVAVLRLAGIYGPGRNALAQLRAGTAKRVIKPGQVFGRVHVADIAAIIDAAFAAQAQGVFNVSDDEPAPPQDVIEFAAELLGLAPPSDISFEDAAKTMSPMALSFYSECRRVRNERVKRELGIALRYPTYREGLRALKQDN